jgi:hypothetical protein
MISFICFLAAAFVALLKIFGADVEDAIWWFSMFFALGFAFARIGPAGPWVRQ